MSTYDARRSPDEMETWIARYGNRLNGLVQNVETMFGTVPVGTVVAGSLRRARDGADCTIGDLDVMVTPTVAAGPEVDMTALALPDWLTVTAKKAHGWLGPDGDRVMVDAWWCPYESLGPFLLFLTGPARLNVWMRQMTTRARPDLMLTQYGLFETVSKPTKTYPDRRVAAGRVDAPLPDRAGLSAVECEQWFWQEWTRVIGADWPYPTPTERERRWG